jgi:hypothetical protein
MLEAGRCRSIAEIAEAEKIDRSFVSQLLDLTLLAPDIQEAIVEGRQVKGMQLDELMRAMATEWEQRRLVILAWRLAPACQDSRCRCIREDRPVPHGHRQPR